jgi:hypothetical protein
MFRRLLREPLLHFLLLGCLMFALFGRGSPTGGVADHDIVVGGGDIERLAAAFAGTWHRPPDDGELQAQVKDYVREEVLYRAALRLGLDKDDTIIRRRLRQKMEFLFEDTVPTPLESDLRAYLLAHVDKFSLPPLVSFRQVFVSAKRGNAAEPDAKRILANLAADAPGAANASDALLLGETFTRTPLDRVAALFGDGFVHDLAKATPGEWEGPLRSSYGLHLVLVTAVEPAAAPVFEQVRPAVEREWYAERRSAAQAAQYDAVLAGFRVTVQDTPVPAR